MVDRRDVPDAADPRTAVRLFDLQVTDMLSAMFIPSLIDDLRIQAPGISLRLRPEHLEDTPGPARRIRGSGDRDIRPGDPEIRSETLVTETLVGVVRPGNPLARMKTVTPRRFALADHVAVSRRGRAHGPIDEQLAGLGLRRQVVAVVPSFASALFLAPSQPPGPRTPVPA